MDNSNKLDMQFDDDETGYSFGKNNVFSHQQLVMASLKKVLELGARELREGWWQDSVDKQGNLRREYHEDTRKAFIEAVKTLMIFVVCDYDEDAEKNISALVAKLKERKEYWLNQEWTWWAGLNTSQKDSLSREGKAVVRGFFNKKLDFDNFYYEDEVNTYREIATEINNLTKRLDFYAAQEYEA